MNNEKFNQDYFENGEILGISGYRDYRWMPELTIRMAYHIIKYLNLNDNDKVLDYGCAKGFLVKALRILDINAYGCDISSYAISKCDAEVKDYCFHMSGTIPFQNKFKYIISKDVLEHLNEDELDNFLMEAHNFTNKMFLIIPLGYIDNNNNERFIIENYENDITHILRKPIEWWNNKLMSHKWNFDSCTYSVKGIKESWTNFYNNGNVFYKVYKN